MSRSIPAADRILIVRPERSVLDRDLHDRSDIPGTMRYLTHGVYVLGTRRGRQSNAMTASWVMQTSERPPCVAVAVDRKSTRLNSSHANISYAVFCLKKKKT